MWASRWSQRRSSGQAMKSDRGIQAEIRAIQFAQRKIKQRALRFRLVIGPAQQIAEGSGDEFWHCLFHPFKPRLLDHPANLATSARSSGPNQGGEPAAAFSAICSG